MVEFNRIKQLFPEDKYEIGVLSREETWQLGQSKLADEYSLVGAIPLTSETGRFWRKIKNSLIILQYSNIAHDYSIKPETQQILVPHFKKNIFLVTIDLKGAAIKAGLGCRGYNNLVWNPKFGFDCKITAWAFCVEIKGYQRPDLPEYLPICNVGCLSCRRACPSQAFSGEKIGEFKFDKEKCKKIIGPQIRQFRQKNNLILNAWNGVAGGIKHCRACQEQSPCKVAMHDKNR
jgi:epoxyqueuosine reductase QueG